MSPSAEPADLSIAAGALAPAVRIEDGEVVILAVKPSRWFVLLVSWPLLLLAAVVAGAAYLAGEALGTAVNQRLVALLFSAVACARLTAACFQWQGRLYVLTDRRVIRLRGMFREELWQCPLRGLGGIHLSATLLERLFGVGSLLFERNDGRGSVEGEWIHLADPKEVHRLVQEAWSRTRTGGGPPATIPPTGGPQQTV